jgi:hypothetical protein
MDTDRRGTRRSHIQANNREMARPGPLLDGTGRPGIARVSNVGSLLPITNHDDAEAAYERPAVDGLCRHRSRVACCADYKSCLAQHALSSWDRGVYGRRYLEDPQRQFGSILALLTKSGVTSLRRVKRVSRPDLATNAGARPAGDA